MHDADFQTLARGTVLPYTSGTVSAEQDEGTWAVRRSWGSGYFRESIHDKDQGKSSAVLNPQATAVFVQACCSYTVSFAVSKMCSTGLQPLLCKTLFERRRQLLFCGHTVGGCSHPSLAVSILDTMMMCRTSARKDVLASLLHQMQTKRSICESCTPPKEGLPNRNCTTGGRTRSQDSMHFCWLWACICHKIPAPQAQGQWRSQAHGWTTKKVVACVH